LLAIFFALFSLFVLYGLGFILYGSIPHISLLCGTSIILGLSLFGFVYEYVVGGHQGYDLNSTIPMGLGGTRVSPYGPEGNATVSMVVSLADLAYRKLDPKDYYAPYHDAWSQRLHVSSDGITESPLSHQR
jgi:hypothetical protein